VPNTDHAPHAQRGNGGTPCSQTPAFTAGQESPLGLVSNRTAQQRSGVSTPPCAADTEQAGDGRHYAYVPARQPALVPHRMAPAAGLRPSTPGVSRGLPTAGTAVRARPRTQRAYIAKQPAGTPKPGALPPTGPRRAPAPPSQLAVSADSARWTPCPLLRSVRVSILHELDGVYPEDGGAAIGRSKDVGGARWEDDEGGRGIAERTRRRVRTFSRARCRRFPRCRCWRRAKYPRIQHPAPTPSLVVGAPPRCVPRARRVPRRRPLEITSTVLA